MCACLSSILLYASCLVPAPRPPLPLSLACHALVLCVLMTRACADTTHAHTDTGEQGTLGLGFNSREGKVVVASLPPGLPAQLDGRIQVCLVSPDFRFVFWDRSWPRGSIRTLAIQRYEAISSNLSFLWSSTSPKLPPAERLHHHCKCAQCAS